VTAISPAKLRRIDLECQGLLRRAPFGSGLPGVRRAIERLGYVQIDTISVVERAHDHVLRTRVPGYRSDMLERLLARAEIFEYWAHAAAYLPMADYRFALPRMHAMRARRERWVRSHDDALMTRVLDRVRVEGPLKARDFDAPNGAGRSAGWWDWKPAKRALEQLFMQGDLMVVGRQGFQKVYDLTERALPGWVDTRPPTVPEFARHLIDRQVRAHGLASVRSCCYQRPTPGLRAAVTGVLRELEEAGRLERLAVNGDSDVWYADPRVLARRAPSTAARARLLSPFDNVLIQRRRAQALYGFEYQIECYVPEPKRRFGYYCLPILLRDRFVGRADCKAHRGTRRLEVRALYIEHPDVLGSGRRSGRRRGHEAGIGAIAAALGDLAGANGCREVDLTSVSPAKWRPTLQRACANLETAS
jgi:uncharacterized protein